MNHKIKRKWCAALRGGTWEQCYGQTSGGGKLRCVLGVLGEVMGLDVAQYRRQLTEGVQWTLKICRTKAGPQGVQSMGHGTGRTEILAGQGRESIR